ncbi:MAG: pimeloyl-ACP methyl esterase BioG family protein [Bacteroidales bacterium]
MKTYIRRREKNDTLIVFYAGWGADEHVFTPLCNDEFDFILFYNYSADEALVLPETKTYRSITLIGWSLGVWAAEYLSPKTGIVPDYSIAVNGTPVPADDHFGIPLNVFEGTLNNITGHNMEKFYLRMFGDKTTYLRNIDKIPHRSIRSLHDELRWLYNRIMEQTEPGFRWDAAVMSETDRVFPAGNMQDYWKRKAGIKHIVLPLPHFPFHEWQSFTDFVNFVKDFNAGGQD